MSDLRRRLDRLEEAAGPQRLERVILDAPLEAADGESVRDAWSRQYPARAFGIGPAMTPAEWSALWGAPHD